MDRWMIDRQTDIPKKSTSLSFPCFVVYVDFLDIPYLGGRCVVTSVRFLYSS